MRKLALVLLLSLLLLGCITQKTYPTKITESVVNTRTFDFEEDGSADLIIYDFAPVKQNQMTLKRQVAIAVHTKQIYSSYKAPTLIEIANTGAKLEAFDKSQKTALQGCADQAGLKYDCTLISACNVLCSGSSKCRRVLDKYQTIIPASMIEFVDDRNELDGHMVEARNAVPLLTTASDDQKNDYLGSIRAGVAKLAEVFSNPLYTRTEIDLCSMPELRVTDLAEAANTIGNVQTTEREYNYYVTLFVSGSDEGEGVVSGVEFVDQIPAAFAQSDDFSSQQKIDVGLNGSAHTVEWVSEQPSQEGYMLGYSFVSSNGPEEVIPALSSPLLKVNRFDMTALAFTDALFNMLYMMMGNFFFALGVSAALSIVLIIILYNIVVIGFSVIKAKISGEKALTGVRRALGRTELRWKSDLILGLILLAAGYYISVFVVSQPAAPLTLLGALSYFTTLSMDTAAGLAGIACLFLGVLLVFSAIENHLKITVLEQFYGIAIKEEEDLFKARIDRLKERMKELQKMVELRSTEEFDVSQEYDVLTSLSAQRIDELAKRMSVRSKKVIEEDLNKVEAAIERLSERKKMADENWPKWMEVIENMLVEQDEVYLTSLITIPASLRTWALRRYVKEKGAEGMVFERDSIKKKRVTPEMFLKSMIDSKLVLGAVVMKKDRVLVAKMGEGSATVPAILAVKLKNYLRSLARSVGQHEPVSFAAVGGKNVLVLMKVAGLESILIIPKGKFKEAIDVFKKKAGTMG